MEIAFTLPVNTITILPQKLFLSHIKNKEKTPKTNKSKPKTTNSTWGVTLIFPDSLAYGLVPVSSSSTSFPYVSGWNYVMQLGYRTIDHIHTFKI